MPARRGWRSRHWLARRSGDQIVAAVVMELALRASLSIDPPYPDVALGDMSFVRIVSAGRGADLGLRYDRREGEEGWHAGNGVW
jgi:hypothetical protein